MNRPTFRHLLAAVFILPVFTGRLPADEAAPVLSVERGPVLANKISHTLDSGNKDLVTGNGDISLMWTASPHNWQLSFGKSDFWGVVRGNITTAGNLHINCNELQSSTFQIQQNLGPATITGNFTKENAALTTSAWVAYPQNLVVTELHNTGSVPLHLYSRLADGLGSSGLPSTTGSSSDSTWIQVSPDLVDFQVGNRQLKNFHLPLIGSIAGLRITSPDYANPAFLDWDPAGPVVRNIGNLKITPHDLHGDSVQIDGKEDHRLILRGGCIPEAAFTFDAWVNPSQITSDATIFAGIAREKPEQYPYFRGFLVHLVEGKPEVRWNYFTAASGTPIPVNQWSEIKTVYENQVLTLYVNGQSAAQGTNPTADAQMGWDKCTLRTGDPALPFKGCAPQGLLCQRVANVVSTVDGQTLSFILAPGKTAAVLVSIVSDRNTRDFKRVAHDLVNSSDAEVARFKTAHDKWWHDFWSKSFVEIPDQRILENWYGSLYVLACCSRGDCPPPGLWHNFIKGMSVGWDGDYTLDYNYQAPFWAAYATNHFELADNYEPLLLAHISRGESIAQNAWRIDTAQQPNSFEKYIAQRAAISNENSARYPGIYLYTHLIPLPGWSNDYGTFWNQKSNAVFCCVNMVQRWRLTRDEKYAREIYPFLKGTADFWDAYLTFENGHYNSRNDAVCESGGTNHDKNPATTLSFLRLLYPAVIEISERLNTDADRRAGWRNVLDKLSPFTYVSASQLSFLKSTDTTGKSIIRNSEEGGLFPSSAYFQYHDRKERGSSAGMNATQAVFPGWSFGLESPDDERNAALNTVTYAAEWYDFNNDCTFYPAAAAIGYDPREILENLRGLIDTSEQPDFRIKTGGGGTEDDAITPATLTNMFVQSYQKNLHIFPNWPIDQEAMFGDLPACGGFLVSSQVKSGKISYVRITSKVGETCHLLNPWSGAARLKRGDSTITVSGKVLDLQTAPGETILLAP
jgi:hypothetical protein